MQGCPERISGGGVTNLVCQQDSFITALKYQEMILPADVKFHIDLLTETFPGGCHTPTPPM